MTKLQIGRVARAHGVRGFVRVNGGAAALGLDAVTIGGALRTIESAQPAPGGVLLKLVGVDDRDQAEALRGEPVWADRALLPPPAADELYVADLIGLPVFDAAGRELGRVASTFDSGAHEILVVKNGAREFLLPLIAPIVTGVDLERGRIDCDPPEGLIE